MLSRSRFGVSAYRVLQLLLTKTILSVELIDTAASLSSLLLACIERMALGADLDVDLFPCGTGGKSIAAVAGYVGLIVIRMDALSHDFYLAYHIICG